MGAKNVWLVIPGEFMSWNKEVLCAILFLLLVSFPFLSFCYILSDLMPETNLFYDWGRGEREQGKALCFQLKCNYL